MADAEQLLEGDDVLLADDAADAALFTAEESALLADEASALDSTTTTTTTTTTAAASAPSEPSEPWMMPVYNPHVAQAVSDAGVFSGSVHPDALPPRVITADSPELEYHRRLMEKKSTMHWGQRTRLLAEIEFLTREAHAGDTVLYAGAAAGGHFAYLASLFPRVQVVVVDPNPCVAPEPAVAAVPEDGPANLTFRVATFDEAVAAEYRGRDDLLFIMGIPSAHWPLYRTKELNEFTLRNMRFQERCCNAVCARVALLKFHLPWQAGYETYLAGDVYFPVWNHSSGTTGLLVVYRPAEAAETTEATGATGAAEATAAAAVLPSVVYSNEQHERRFFAFNTVTRVGLYPHTVRAAGLDHCYDCACEVAILRAYRRSEHAPALGWDDTEDEAVAALIAAVSRAACDAGDKSLEHPPLPPLLYSPEPVRKPKRNAFNKDGRRVVVALAPEERARRRGDRRDDDVDLRDVLNRKRGAGDSRRDRDGDDADDGNDDDENATDEFGRRLRRPQQRRRRDADGHDHRTGGDDAAGEADGHSGAGAPRATRDQGQWQRIESKSQGGFYFYNTATGECQWEVPLGFVAPEDEQE